MVLNCSGVLDNTCQPDSLGRQVILAPNMYPTDVINILTETGGSTLLVKVDAGNMEKLPGAWQNNRMSFYHNVR